MRLSLCAVAVLAALAAGCGGAQVCAPNSTMACTCTDGRSGAQVCDGAGSGFSSCQCTASTTKYIFITATRYNGDLGGLDGADAKCNLAAQAQNVSGTFKAWLSSSTVDAIDRMADVGPWYLIGSQAKVFNNKAGLMTLPLVKIDYNEQGVMLTDFTERRAWTGTNVGGTGSATSAQLCRDWTETGSGVYGWAGTSEGTNNSWTANATTLSCMETLRLYCIQQ